MYDLHIHTKASDGILSPEEVIDKSISIGLAGISITDHDTVDGLEAAEKYLAQIKTNLKFIPGIELNTDYKNSEVHILGYFIDYYSQPFLDKLIEFKNSRYGRAEKMIGKLRSMGFTIDIQMVEKIAGSDIIGRPHIAQALVDKGYVFSVKEAFDKYIS
ncbi:MAG: PHP domain-containing protein, partial [Syntrophomonadaceae bacterium]|nr:PHP domain-containing protein [Syntrophomonadaceae bacterium]